MCFYTPVTIVVYVMNVHFSEIGIHVPVSQLLRRLDDHPGLFPVQVVEFVKLKEIMNSMDLLQQKFNMLKANVTGHSVVISDWNYSVKYQQKRWEAMLKGKDCQLNVFFSVNDFTAVLNNYR